MKKRVRLFLLFPLFIIILGCTHIISKDLRSQADPHLSFTQVRENPSIYKGKSVIWGGEIITTITLKGGMTEIEVFHRPLNWRGEPKLSLPSEGRFLILSEKYLDPYLYRKGRKITVGGKIQGEKIKPIGEMDYRYPIILSEEIYLWEDYTYLPRYSYYPYYYDPWWRDHLWGRFYLHYHRHL